VIYLGKGQLHDEVQRPGSRSSSSRRNVMAGFYLGIAVAGVNALIAMGLVIVLM
jgi:hypothetical protein